VKYWLKRILPVLLIVWLSVESVAVPGTDATQLFYQLREKLSGVKDYVADVRMNIQVKFMHVPTITGKLYYKYPDKVKLERNGGVTILPKRTMSLSLNDMIPEGKVTAIDVGYEMVGGVKTRVIKVVPESEQTEIVLTKVWVDESRKLAMRTETTTKENGTIRMELTYGKYVAQFLPDKVVLYMDVNEYKLPKGVTMDYESDETAEFDKKEKSKSGKGRIEIIYLNYKTNVGLSDEIFIEKK
jgi:outer membrane lipoprotein-sorting protein